MQCTAAPGCFDFEDLVGGKARAGRQNQRLAKYSAAGMLCGRARCTADLASCTVVVRRVSASDHGALSADVDGLLCSVWC